MPEGLNRTKKRIKSISNTQKLTSAMELIASAKLKRYKDTMLQNRSYVDAISDCFSILSRAKNAGFAEILEEKPKSDVTLYIIVNSNLGLCASYNNDIYKFASKIPHKNSIILPIGKRGYSYFKNEGYELNDEFVTLNEKIDYDQISKFSHYIIEEFNKGSYKEIRIIYSKFINSLTSRPVEKIVLPLEEKDEKELTLPPIIEPDAETLIKSLFPIYVSSLIYSSIIESQVSEQSARRKAMEDANDNADELLEKLRIEYNKARQSAITQEITEIVSGSNVK